MNARPRLVAQVVILLAALTGTMIAPVGCTLITDIDRNKIQPEGTGGSPGDASVGGGGSGAMPEDSGMPEPMPVPDAGPDSGSEPPDAGPTDGGSGDAGVTDAGDGG